ncbi:MAG TPA: hypothetical protein VGG64_08380 [Pirellulales bacterium]|jgi:hypothetical protein
MQLVTPEAESEPTVDTDLAAEVFFYAVERHTWTRDALYRVYLKDRHVAGAWVAGPVRDAASCQLQYGGHWTFNWLLRRILKKALAQRIERERFYNEINPFADGFLELDRRNFQFSGSDIRRIRVKYERVNDVPGSAGTVEIDTLCGARHKLIVLGGWLPDELVNRLRLLDRGIEVEGADAFRTPAEHNAFYQRHSLTNQAVACFGLAAGAALLWWTRWLVNPRLPLLATFCAGWACWSLYQARQVRNEATAKSTEDESQSLPDDR